MNTPKILPRFAAIAGISVKHAEKLWSQATRETREIMDEDQSPEYWKAAMARMLDLIEAEKLRDIPSQYTPLIAMINAVRMMPALLAMQRGAAASTWQGLTGVGRPRQLAGI